VDLAAVIDRLAAAGVSLGIDRTGDGLTFDSPRPLTPAQLDYLSRHKAAILAHLRQAGSVAQPPADPPPTPPPLTPDERADLAEAIAERAAIMEHDGGLSRQAAEAAAAARMRVYRLHIAMPDGPPRWAVLLAPGCDLAEATRTAHNQFGAERVLSVQPSQEPHEAPTDDNRD
jgi:hypothetical protein